MRFSDWWPFVWRYRHDLLRLENFTLRSALKDANEELRKHRATIVERRRTHEHLQQHK